MSGEKCIALADYNALASDEISFHAGDVLSVTAKGGFGGFWQGYVLQCPHLASTGAAPPDRTNAKTGYFPNCFVTSNLQGHSPLFNTFVNKAVCLYDFLPPPAAAAKKAEDEDTMYFHKNDILTVLAPSAHPGWWYGVNETERWRRRASPAAAASPSDANILLFPTNFVSCQIVLAVYEFDASPDAAADGEGDRYSKQQREVGCLPGDVLLLHRQWNDGWWEGTRSGFFPLPEGRTAALPPATRHKIEARLRDLHPSPPPTSSDPAHTMKKVNPRGIFPSNYTIPNVCTTRPLFFCQKCKQIRAEAQQCVSHGRPTSAVPVSPLALLNSSGALSQGDNHDGHSDHHAATYLSEVGGGGGASCAYCAQQERLVDQMLFNITHTRTNNNNNNGKAPKVDLFAGISLLPPAAGSNNNTGNNDEHNGNVLSLLSLKDVADAKNVKFDGKV